MVKIKALTFREKQNTLEAVFKQYKRAQVKLYCLQETQYYPQLYYGLVRDQSRKYKTSNMISKLNANLETKEELQNVIDTFECIIESLSEDSKMIITKEFIEHFPHDWWIGYFAKSTYYRMKTKAMEEMLFYLNI